jgi:glycosyltransferase involved in cell wall biosynthesis
MCAAITSVEEGFVRHETKTSRASIFFGGIAEVGVHRRRMVVKVVGDEHVASTRFRVLAHLDALRSAGFDVELELQSVPRFPLLRAPLRLRELVRDTTNRSDADLLFLHRRTYPPPFARRLAGLGFPVVFDVDDALYLPPPSAPQTRANLARYRRNFEATANAADLVLCGSFEAAREVPHRRVEILPTPIDCRLFRPDAVVAAKMPTIGWVGHSDNLPYLEALSDPLRELARRHPDLRLVVVADRPPHMEGLPVEFRKWTLAEEVSCFSDVTIGLMPLDDTPWARAKCAFKLLQYMALGIPAVASPVGMNSEVVQDGVNGLLARGPEEWLAAIDRLLGDPDLCRRLAGEGRRTVEQHYSLEVVSSRLVTLLVGLTDVHRTADEPQIHVRDE